MTLSKNVCQLGQVREKHKLFDLSSSSKTYERCITDTTTNIFGNQHFGLRKLMTGNTEKYFWQLQEREQKWNKLSQQNKKKTTKKAFRIQNSKIQVLQRKQKYR